MEGLIKCPNCNRKYSKSATLKDHLQQVHKQNVDEIDVAQYQRVQPRKRVESAAAKFVRERYKSVGGVKTPYRYVPKKKVPRHDDEAHQLRIETERKCASIVERARTNPDDCSICMNAPAGSGAVIPCGHSTFCYACLKEWGPEKGCPMCRGRVQIIQELKI